MAHTDSDSLNVLKARIKQWESEFCAAHQRPPTAEDVRQQPTIETVYKQYRQVKRSLSAASQSSPIPTPVPVSAPLSVIPVQSLYSTYTAIGPSSQQSSTDQSQSQLNRALSAITRRASKKRKFDDQFGFQPVACTPAPPPPVPTPTFTDVDDIAVSTNGNGSSEISYRPSSAPAMTSDAASFSPSSPPSKDMALNRNHSSSTSMVVTHRSSSLSLRVGFEPPSASPPTPILRSVIAVPTLSLSQSQLDSSASVKVQTDDSHFYDDDPSTIELPIPSVDDRVMDSEYELEIQSNTEIRSTTTKKRSQRKSQRKAKAPPALSDAEVDANSGNDNDKPSQPMKTARRAKKSSVPDSQDNADDKPTLVSNNFVSHNLRRRTKAYGRAGVSAKAARRREFRSRRGWLSKGEWKQKEQLKQQSISDGQYLELVEPPPVTDSDTSKDSGNESVANIDTNDTPVVRSAPLPPVASLPSYIPPSSAETDDELSQLLQLHFNHHAFRDGQLQSIRHTLSSPSASSLLLLPTGYGKSLCYLIPALKLRLTLIVSPLLSLMNDQLSNLPSSLPGVVWSSHSTRDEIVAMMRSIKHGSTKIVYVSPEKVISPSFQMFLQSLHHLDLIVIDEAHCVSQWSHNFRPSYLYLKQLLTTLRTVNPSLRLLTMTATATVDTIADIKVKLNEPLLTVLQFGPKVRTNINIRVKRVMEDSKNQQVLDWIVEYQSLQKSLRRKSKNALLMASPPRGIVVYVNYRNHADRLMQMLESHGLNVRSYHAGLSYQQRASIQSLFLSSSLSIIVATIAFGLGIDKPNIGLVIHTFLPSSLSSYTQEIGRCGRDGVASEAWLCFSDRDELNQQSWCHKQSVEMGTMRTLMRWTYEAITITESHTKNKKVKPAHTHTDSDNGNSNGCGGHAPYVALNLSKIESELKLEQQVVETLITAIELSSAEPCIRMIGSANNMLDLSVYRSADTLTTMIADNDSHNAQLLSLLLARYHYTVTVNEATGQHSLTFKKLSLAVLANQLQWDWNELMQCLLSLREMRELSMNWKFEKYLVLQLNCYRRHSVDTLAHYDSLIAAMEAQCKLAVRQSMSQVESLIGVMRKCEGQRQPTAIMHRWLEHYFTLTQAQFTDELNGTSGSGSGTDDSEFIDLEASLLDIDEPTQSLQQLPTQAQSVIDAPLIESTLLSLVSDCYHAGYRSLTGHSFSAILHAMSTAAVCASDWSRSQHWGRLKHVPFAALEEIAARMIRKHRASLVLTTMATDCSN